MKEHILLLFFYYLNIFSNNEKINFENKSANTRLGINNKNRFKKTIKNRTNKEKKLPKKNTRKFKPLSKNKKFISFKKNFTELKKVIENTPNVKLNEAWNNLSHNIKTNNDIKEDINTIKSIANKNEYYDIIEKIDENKDFFNNIIMVFNQNKIKKEEIKNQTINTKIENKNKSLSLQSKILEITSNPNINIQSLNNKSNLNMKAIENRRINQQKNLSNQIIIEPLTKNSQPLPLNEENFLEITKNSPLEIINNKSDTLSQQQIHSINMIKEDIKNITINYPDLNNTLKRLIEDIDNKTIISKKFMLEIHPDKNFYSAHNNKNLN